MVFRDADERRAIEALAATYSNFGESILALARVCFRLTLIVRFFLLPGPWFGGAWPRAVLAIGSAVATLAFSLWGIALADRRGFRKSTHTLSALIDVSLCAVALFSTSRWPEVGYTGLMSKPDVAFLCILVFAGTLRLERRAITASTIASLLALFALARYDVTANAPHAICHTYDLAMMAIMILVAGTAAWLSALVVRRLLVRVVREAASASRSRRHLRTLMREHHDVRTQISSATLHLDLLLGKNVSDSVRTHAATAARAVAAIADVVEGIRRQAFGELVTSETLVSVEVGPVVDDVVACVRARFPAVALNFEAAPRTAVALFGGERGLAHVLVNVLINACEGNGRKGASHIALVVRPDSMRPDFVEVEFLDDGPGFPDEILRSGARRGLSTKADGSGLGLGLVQGLVEASGGNIAIENRPGGGARVLLWFRVGRDVSVPWAGSGVEAELGLP